MRRRQVLTAVVAATAGVAGCTGGNSDSGSNASTTGSGGATTTGSGSDGSTTTGPSDSTTTEGGSNLSTAKTAVKTFYGTLYGEDDIEGANALYHPKSPAPELKASNFEAFGGVEAIDSEIESLDVVSKGSGRATVHATVAYSTPAGSSTTTDYVYLRKQAEQWKVNVWLPQTARRRIAKETVREFYRTLYEENDIEGANAMYHPESDAGPIEASDFEPFGGIENMQAEITSVEVVSEGGGTAEVHADVEYSTPAGTSTATDYVFLRLQRGAWKIDRWAPEAARESGDKTTTSGS